MPDLETRRRINVGTEENPKWVELIVPRRAFHFIPSVKKKISEEEG